MENIVNIAGFVSVFISVLAAGWKLSSELACARGLAEEALRESKDAVRYVERAEDEARDTHKQLFDKLDEIKDDIHNLKD